MQIDKIKEWIPPNDSYGFAAFETFKGDIFSLRTGDRVSVLNTINGDFRLTLCGSVNVASDAECWKIVIKLNKIDEVITELITTAYCAGKIEAKKELRCWLEL